mmetsp:Transcript_9972/g.21554  ORF Transcript_9972/g.21554 Transcript_9972/m.21554 type:complete len:221 (-) Transcript_9972:483-1145(-)
MASSYMRLAMLASIPASTLTVYKNSRSYMASTPRKWKTRGFEVNLTSRPASDLIPTSYFPFCFASLIVAANALRKYSVMSCCCDNLIPRHLLRNLGTLQPLPQAISPVFKPQSNIQKFATTSNVRPCSWLVLTSASHKSWYSFASISPFSNWLAYPATLRSSLMAFSRNSARGRAANLRRELSITTLVNGRDFPVVSSSSSLSCSSSTCTQLFGRSGSSL